MRVEEVISFDFLQGEGNGFLTEWAADFFEGVEVTGRCFLDEVDIRETPLH